MNDRELLALAAKAAKIELSSWDEKGEQWIREVDDPSKVGQTGNGWGAAVFDPLADDGDALRLAAQLKIDILHIGLTVRSRVHGDHGMVIYEAAEFSQDRALDIRRSVVRAAAHIGDQMP